LKEKSKMSNLDTAGIKVHIVHTPQCGRMPRVPSVGDNKKIKV
jgi:hypothetical protein